MRNSLVALAVLLLGLSPVASTVAWAQAATEVDAVETPVDEAASDTPEPAAPPPRARKGIEEIVVMAGESDAAADLQAGDSVTGFDASDLEALGAQSIEDLAGFTPNLEIVTTGATTPTFFIRGVGLNDFSPNSTGAVGIYQDDVPKNAPALQLSTLFDMEAVNVLRGPQGTGPARNASAGAIKLYARRPSGEFGGFLRSELGNFNSRDFEGAVEMPLYEDILSTRLAFRYSARDGYMKNNCGSNPRPDGQVLIGNVPNANLHKFDPSPEPGANYNPNDGNVYPSVCGEKVFPLLKPYDSLPRELLTGLSPLPEGLPSEMNDRGNWASRGMLRFQPTLDQDWLLTFNLSKRNQYAEVGQSIGTGEEARICDFDQIHARPECRIGAFGSAQGNGGSVLGYQPVELVRATNRLNDCIFKSGIGQPGNPTDRDDTNLQSPASINLSVPGCETQLRAKKVDDAAKVVLARSLVLDDEPFEGDFNRAGKVKLDVWSASLKGDIAIGDSLSFRTVTGFDTYDRSNFADLDFSPNVLFEIGTDDEGWQFVQDFQLSGALSQELPVNWQLGGFALIEELDAFTDILLPDVTQLRAVTQRDWTQKLYSAAGYFSFDWDFWNDFTLDGGVRYNWEKKTLDMTTFGNAKHPDNPSPFGVQTYRVTNIQEADTWQAPTGTIRLTYRFREDTHAYWKYTRGWKGGHYNVTVSDLGVITTAEPEEIDAFEIGLRGSWFNGRLGLNASVFHYAYRNYQIFTVVIPLTGTPEFQVLNASDAEVYGGELELTARPISGMFLEARFGWLESQFLDFKQTQTQIQTVGNTKVSILRELDFSGNRLLNSPPFKVSLTAEQTIPLGRLGSLTARWDGAWSDETSYDASEGAGTPTFEGVNIFPENTIGQAAYWIHNFRLGYRTPDGSVELSAFVRNATDELYKTFAFDVSGITLNATTIHFLGEPRTYGLGLTVNF